MLGFLAPNLLWFTVPAKVVAALAFKDPLRDWTIALLLPLTIFSSLMLVTYDVLEFNCKRDVFGDQDEICY
jgi:hypothetical protein